MIRATKRQLLSNLPWVVFFGLFFFTPIGFHAKVFFARIFSSSAAPLEATEQRTFSDYSWRLTAIDGEQVDLVDAKDKVVLINFWATWCPPCMAEMPGFEKLYEDYGERVTFVFVAQDTRERVKKYMETSATRLPIFFAAEDVPGMIYSKSIPATYIIDKSGTLVLSKIGVADWNSEKTRVFLDQLLGDSL